MLHLCFQTLQSTLYFLYYFKAFLVLLVAAVTGLTKSLVDVKKNLEP